MVFHDDGNTLVFKDLFFMQHNEKEISLAESFSNLDASLSSPAAFERCSFVS